MSIRIPVYVGPAPIVNMRAHNVRTRLTAAAGNNTITLGGAPVAAAIYRQGRLVALDEYTIAGNVITLATPATAGHVYMVDLWTANSNATAAGMSTM